MDPNEERFLVIVDDAEKRTEGERPPGLTSVNIVFNWFTELNEKAPTGRQGKN